MMGFFKNIIDTIRGRSAQQLLQAEGAGVEAGRQYANDWEITKSEDVNMDVLDDLTDHSGYRGYPRGHMFQVGFLEGVDGWEWCEQCQGYWPPDHGCGDEKQSKL